MTSHQRQSIARAIGSIASMMFGAALGSVMQGALAGEFDNDFETIPFRLAIAALLLPPIILYCVWPRQHRSLREAIYWTLSLALFAGLWAYSFGAHEGTEILRMIAAGLLGGTIAAYLAGRAFATFSSRRSMSSSRRKSRPR